MKNTFLLVLFCTLTLTVSAQIPKEAFDLTNGMYKLWQSSPKGKAIDASIKLNKLYQPFFIEKIHNELSQTLLDDRSKAYPQEYLKALWDLHDPSIRNIIEPMYV